MENVKGFGSAEVNALSVREAAKVYIQHGLAVVPDKPKSKQPAINNWLNAKIALEEVSSVFHEDSNISILLGKPSGGLVCVDIDDPVALQLTAYLPHTPCVHGRSGMPNSHYWYVVEEHTADSMQFKHPGGGVLAEILGNKRKVTSPPSVHESGEKIVWTGDGAPAHTMYIAVKGAVGIMCAATLLAKSWPSKGSRNHAALALAGMLLKNDMDVEQSEQFVRRVTKAANDEESEARVACVKPTWAKIEKGDPIVAMSDLAKLVGQPIVERVKQFLNFKGAIGLADSVTLEGELNAMNERHAVIQLGGTAAILNEEFDPTFGRIRATFSKPVDLRLRYQNRKFAVPDPLTGDLVLRTLADIWLDLPGRRQYLGIEFNPQTTTPGYWNRFRGFAVAPKEGDCGLFLAHIKNVICAGNEQHYAYVLRWMAHTIQKPEERPETALVLRGKQGVGKGVFVDHFGALIGQQHYLTVYKDGQITGRFNSHLMDVLLVHLNEATWGGHKDAAGTLKGLITDPTTPIEAKGKDIFQVKNYVRVIVASNETWVLPLDLDDRRFLVLEVADSHKEDHSYFEKLVTLMNSGGGLEALMFHLKTLDLTGFDIRKVPASAHAFDLKLQSAEPHVQWWFQKLKDSHTEGWPLQVAKAHIHEEYREWCSKMKMHHPLTLELFARQLKKLVPTLASVKLTQSNPIIPGGVRVSCFKLPPLSDCRQFMQGVMKADESVWV